MPDSLPDIYPNEIGSEAVSDFAPLIDKYGDPNQSLATYLNGIALMYKQVDDIAKDGPAGEPGWSQVFDLVRAKTEWLPWTGQLVGRPVPVQPDNQTLEEYDAVQRERIVTRSAYLRGTVAALRSAIEDQLHDPKRVIIFERYGGDPDRIRVWVYSADIATSVPEVTQAARFNKFASLLMTFTVLSGAGDYDIMSSVNETYQDVLDGYVDYQELLDNPDHVS
jgi:hypothetical protein